MSTPIIQIQHLKKSFGTNKVLDDFHLELYEGESLVVMGKSGSGKSVMIKCLVGLVQPDIGTIEIMGKNMMTLEQEELDEIRTEVGFLFQGSALYDSMSVRENLEFPLRRHTKKFGKIKDATPMVLEALKSVGLENAIDLMPNELSGGMKRRIALARTLILKPKIILYDEPTTGLDPITSKEIIQLMKSIQKTYKTSSIVITHDIDCARVVADRMILLIDGKNYIEGTFNSIAQSEDPKVKAFFK
ncbi:Probable ABC-type transport system, ATPase component [Flavobacterium indicum GPTSA100-9 = DSM 17447]|uniref:Probable ABC-type transport system, ATPase component n=1 Tax=Flavobacterium indicum (strain DSM 17447 / CIP 109464 / GPTSA100-9) TaxID=1094466 RepID=H8XQZ1_FLAIG|nr:ATP-binding cassette domain-containing protein [Flavobacterium indicum]CCG53439.1 Probable ABC-type transport system, ATPase component [Flavobacterium indicum GPTSA100-9 = DSM 17447]